MPSYLSQSSFSWAVSSVQMCRSHSVWGDSLFSLSWIFICLDPNAESANLTILWSTYPSLRIVPTVKSSIGSISAYMFSPPFDFSLLSLSAHCQYDPIGSISHSLCLQHGLGRQLTQPHTYQFTDGGRHRRPGQWQPDQTANHGGVLLKHPEPSHHLTWDHQLVEPLHLRRLSVPFGVLFPLRLCLSFCLFSSGQGALV